MEIQHQIDMLLGANDIFLEYFSSSIHPPPDSLQRLYQVATPICLTQDCCCVFLIQRPSLNVQVIEYCAGANEDGRHNQAFGRSADRGDNSQYTVLELSYSDGSDLLTVLERLHAENAGLSDAVEDSSLLAHIGDEKLLNESGDGLDESRVRAVC